MYVILFSRETKNIAVPYKLNNSFIYNTTCKVPISYVDVGPNLNINTQRFIFSVNSLVALNLFTSPLNEKNYF